jgi:hypothetical protein
MRDLQTLRQELKDARQEVRNLTVMAMRPDQTPEKADLVLKGLRSARAEVKLRVMALNYQLSKESTAPPAATPSTTAPTSTWPSPSPPRPSRPARDWDADPALATMEWAVARLKRDKLERNGYLPVLSATSAPQSRMTGSNMTSFVSEMIEQEVLWMLTMKMRQALPNERKEAIQDKAWKMFEQLRRDRQGD